MKAGCWMVKRETIYKTKQVSRLRGSVARLSVHTGLQARQG